AVIKGKIVGSKVIAMDNSSDPNAFQWIQYEVQQQKMYKGFEKVERIRHVYTPLADFVCGMVLRADEMNEEYVLTGSLGTDGKVFISICSFNRPWSQLTLAQQAGLERIYEAGCHCTVVPCLSLPCGVTAGSQCLWTDGIFTGNWNGTQSQRYACSMKPTGLCQWVSARSTKARALFRRKAQ
ncbi:hypothetical protein scyTo_0023712, partial [Scyliorhinus torazame]|nr:hypothetical protein [Scyliorhinus torazame]